MNSADLQFTQRGSAASAHEAEVLAGKTFSRRRLYPLLVDTLRSEGTGAISLRCADLLWDCHGVSLFLPENRQLLARISSKSLMPAQTLELLDSLNYIGDKKGNCLRFVSNYLKYIENRHSKESFSAYSVLAQEVRNSGRDLNSYLQDWLSIVGHSGASSPNIYFVASASFAHCAKENIATKDYREAILSLGRKLSDAKIANCFLEASVYSRFMNKDAEVGVGCNPRALSTFFNSPLTRLPEIVDSYHQIVRTYALCKWDIEAVTWKLLDVLELQPNPHEQIVPHFHNRDWFSDTKAQLLAKTIRHQLDLGLQVDAAIRIVHEFAHANFTFSRFCESALNKFRRAGIGLDFLSYDLVRSDHRQNGWKHLIESAHHLHADQQAFNSIVADRLLGVSKFFNSEWALQRFQAALKSPHAQNPKGLESFYQELKYQDALCCYLYSSDSNRREEALQLLMDVASVDNPPWGFPSAEATRAWTESVRHLRRAHDGHFGFSCWEFDCKTRPDGEMSLIARMGLDLAKSTKAFNCSDIAKFPGPGFELSNVNPERIFLQDMDSPDPWHRWKEGLPWAADCFEFFEHSKFRLFRGMIQVEGPDLAKFKIKGEHYSLLIFNEHMENVPLEVGWLVPTKLLSKLASAAVPIEDFVGFDINRPDVCALGIDINALRDEAARLNLTIFDIGKSTVLAGMGNAWPAKSEPYFAWEELIDRKMHRSGYPDFWGHAHKAYLDIGFGLSKVVTSNFEVYLKPLREAHYHMRDFCNRYYGLYDLLRYSSSLWHQGKTLYRPPVHEEDRMQTLVPESKVIIGGGSGQVADSGTPLNSGYYPVRLRMMDECYHWHQSLKADGAPIEKYPILCLMRPLNFRAAPQSLLIDTYEMKIFNNGVWSALPENFPDTLHERLMIWDSAVGSKLREGNSVPLLMNRRGLDVYKQ